MIKELKATVTLVTLCGALHGASAHTWTGAGPFVLDGVQLEGLEAVGQAVQRAGNAFEKAGYPEYSRAYFELVSIEGELASMRLTVDDKVSVCRETAWRAPCQDRGRHLQLQGSLIYAGHIVGNWERDSQRVLVRSGPIPERELVLLQEKVAAARGILDDIRELYDALFP